MTDKHNTKYNTLISELPYIHARWSIFTFTGQNEPRPGHGTPWVNSGAIPAIPGRLVLGIGRDVTRKLTLGRLKPMASAGARAYNGGLSGVQGQRPWSGGRSPPEADSFFVDVHP